MSNAPTPLQAMVNEIECLRARMRNPRSAQADRQISAFVMQAAKNWKAASFWKKAVILLLGGQRLCFIHLGCEFTTVELAGVTYLIDAHEVNA